MANRNSDSRHLFPNHSRIPYNLRLSHLNNMENRQQGRLSLGAGIRDLERRTSEVPAILRSNLHNVIEELRPIMERARSVDSAGVTLTPWLNAPAQPAITSPRDSISREAPHTSSNEIVLDIEEGGGSPVSSQTVAHSAENNNNANPSSPIGSVGSEASGGSNPNTNNSVANEEGDENIVLTANDSIALNTIVKYCPFVTLVATKFIFDHIPGIVMFIGLFTSFFYYNALVKREISRQTPRTKWTVSLFVLIMLVGIGGLVYIVYNDVVLEESFGITSQTKYPSELQDLLWSVVVTDFIIKIATVVFKGLFSLIPQGVLACSKRGKYYLFIEASSQLYRGCVPIQPWLHFLLESYTGPRKVIGVFLSAAYMVSKGNLLVNGLKLWWSSLLKVIRNVTIGATPTKEQVALAGNSCSICHDEFKTPVLLECGHIFCEMCVCKWLDREQTCPLCRAKIVDDPSWRDGSTTYLIQVF